MYTYSCVYIYIAYMYIYIYEHIYMYIYKLRDVEPFRFRPASAGKSANYPCSASSCWVRQHLEGPLSGTDGMDSRPGLRSSYKLRNGLRQQAMRPDVALEAHCCKGLNENQYCSMLVLIVVLYLLPEMYINVIRVIFGNAAHMYYLRGGRPQVHLLLCHGGVCTCYGLPDVMACYINPTSLQGPGVPEPFSSGPPRATPAVGSQGPAGVDNVFFSCLSL